MDSSQRTPALHRVLDTLSGILLLTMTVFAPWAFGCTVSWAIWTMCAGGYLLGALLLAKHVVRWRQDYQPERWVTHSGPGVWAVRALAGLTVLMLAWVLTSWFNARAEVEITKIGPVLHYRESTPISWLPTSYDAGRSLRAFWRYLALALTFWAARDWVLTKTRRERKDGDAALFPTERVRQWLWTLCLSSGLLALVSIAQRLDGTDKLLWLIKPAIRNPHNFSWGPYAYRTNGAQYFNLVWPVALGFWWTLRDRTRRTRKGSARLGSDAHIILLPCTLVLAACPLISASRGGALMMLALLVGTLVVLATARGSAHQTGRIVAAVFFLGVLGLGWFAGGSALRERFSTVFEDRLSKRLDLYEAAEKMIDDAGPLGTGAETFTGLYSLYRTNPTDEWHAFAHNDWLETRITFGWVGLLLIIGMLLLVLVHWATGEGVVAPREFTLLLGMSLAGLLFHARFDFPFQMFSLLFLFLMLAAIGLASAPRAGSATTRTSSDHRTRSRPSRSKKAFPTPRDPVPPTEPKITDGPAGNAAQAPG
jgi:hypothetical protein